MLLTEDDFLSNLYPGEVKDISSYATASARIKAAISDHVCDLLSRGISVVLDFPGNTVKQRKWFRSLIDRTGASHRLHFIDASDDCCKRQLATRSQELPPDSPFTSDAEFDAITLYFEKPSDNERFEVVTYERN